MAMGRAIEIWKAQGIPMSREQAYLWMDNYCQSNPLSDIRTGADMLAYEKTNGAYARALKTSQPRR